MKTKLLLSTAIVGLGTLLASPAQAGISIGISVGLPFPPPPRVVVAPPPRVPCPPPFLVCPPRRVVLAGPPVWVVTPPMHGRPPALAAGRATCTSLATGHLEAVDGKTERRTVSDKSISMLQFKRDFEAVFCGARSIEFSRSLNPSLETFATWLGRNRTRLPLD